jgi:hypothetical protein
LKLAELMGRTEAEAKAAVSSPEFTRWLAHYEREGWPDERADRRAAAMISMSAALKGQELSLEKALDLVNPWRNAVDAPSSMSLREKLQSFNAGIRGMRLRKER